MRVAIYARVSTKDQSPDIQTSEIKRFCEMKGWTIVDSYMEQLSGKISDRPELKRLMKDSFEKKFDIVVVWKLDRFGRSLKDLVSRIFELDVAGVQFVSITESLDFTTPAGRFQFQVLSAVAEFEASLIKERISAGLRLAKQRGVKIGRKRSLPELKILTLKQQGLGQREIARQLGCSEAGVRQTLGRNGFKLI